MALDNKQKVQLLLGLLDSAQGGSVVPGLGLDQDFLTDDSFEFIASTVTGKSNNLNSNLSIRELQLIAIKVGESLLRNMSTENKPWMQRQINNLKLETSTVSFFGGDDSETTTPSGTGTVGIGGITVQDEGTTVGELATQLNFTGDGVQVSGEDNDKIVEIAGGTGTAGLAYLATPTVNPSDVTTATSIPNTGAGLAVTLVVQQDFPGGIIASREFFTLWEGSVTAEFDTAVTAVFRLHTRHTFGTNKTFTHTREYLAGARRQARFSIPMSNFNSISYVRLGTFTPPVGDAIEITQADLDGTSKIEYSLEIYAIGSRSTDRVATTLNHISFHDMGSISYQFGPTGDETISETEVDGKITTHNTDTAAHKSIRDSVANKVNTPTFTSLKNKVDALDIPEGLPDAPANDTSVKKYNLNVPITGDATWTEDTGGDGGGTGITSVSTDSTLTGDGSSSDVLKVANPFTDADETKLDALPTNAELTTSLAGKEDNLSAGEKAVLAGEPFTSADHTNLDANTAARHTTHPGLATDAELTAETNARTAADTALGNRITALDVPDGLPDAPANTSANARYELNVPANSGSASWVAARSGGGSTGLITLTQIGSTITSAGTVNGLWTLLTDPVLLIAEADGGDGDAYETLLLQKDDLDHGNGVTIQFGGRANRDITIVRAGASSNNVTITENASTNITTLKFFSLTAAKGEDGTDGDPGAPGRNPYRGVWAADTSYEVGDIITRSSSDSTLLACIVKNSDATFTANNWQSLKGADGRDGADGMDGQDGDPGTNGTNGSDGTDGQDGRTPYRGVWVANTSYLVGDIVTRSSSDDTLYSCVEDNSDATFTDSKWQTLKGQDGAAGTLSADQLARLLPTFPATGSRDNKIPKFDGDNLGWEEDAGGTFTDADETKLDALPTKAELDTLLDAKEDNLSAGEKAVLAGNAFTDTDETNLDANTAARHTTHSYDNLTNKPTDLLLPTLPAEGSRNNKVPKFNGNTLGWEEDAGHVTSIFLDGGLLTWSSSRVYVPRALAKHNDVVYICILSTQGKNAAETEPGKGTAWSTYWSVIGYATAPPDITGLATKTALTTETNARTAADTALGNRITALDIPDLPDAPANDTTAKKYELNVPATTGDATWTESAAGVSEAEAIQLVERLLAVQELGPTSFTDFTLNSGNTTETSSAMLTLTEGSWLVDLDLQHSGNTTNVTATLIDDSSPVKTLASFGRFGKSPFSSTKLVTVTEETDVFAFFTLNATARNASITNGTLHAVLLQGAPSVSVVEQIKEHNEDPDAHESIRDSIANENNRLDAIEDKTRFIAIGESTWVDATNAQARYATSNSILTEQTIDDPSYVTGNQSGADIDLVHIRIPVNEKWSDYRAVWQAKLGNNNVGDLRVTLPGAPSGGTDPWFATDVRVDGQYRYGQWWGNADNTWDNFDDFRLQHTTKDYTWEGELDQSDPTLAELLNKTSAIQAGVIPTGWGAISNDNQGGIATKATIFSSTQAAGATYSKDETAANVRFFAIRIPASSSPQQYRLRLRRDTTTAYISLTATEILDDSGSVWHYYRSRVPTGANEFITLEVTADAAHVGTITWLDKLTKGAVYEQVKDIIKGPVTANDNADTITIADTIQTVTPSATATTVNANNGLIVNLAMNRNVTLTISNGKDGDALLIRATQDSTGSRTLTYDSTDLKLSTGAADKDLLMFHRWGSDWIFIGIKKDV